VGDCWTGNRESPGSKQSHGGLLLRVRVLPLIPDSTTPITLIPGRRLTKMAKCLIKI